MMFSVRPVTKSRIIILLFLLLLACQSRVKYRLDQEVMASLGDKYKNAFSMGLPDLKARIEADPTNIPALLGLAETEILLYIFGYSSREETLPEARAAYQAARRIDSLDPGILALDAKLKLLDWKWDEAEQAFVQAISADPRNPDARHWYSLYLAAMRRLEEALAQHDTIATIDVNEQYLVGRGSMLYFARRNQELVELMHIAIARDSTAPWPYDWLGMAYCELEDFDHSLETYFKAFELSDGTVEVGGGLGHALGLAGEYDPGKQLADYYSQAARDHYVPPVQRAFIHIGLGEHDQAIGLLEQAYDERSWFLVFIQAEPWYDPVRDDLRFQDIMNRMGFPE
jgi:tetratricopeptide (TPR) repeat protein